MADSEIIRWNERSKAVAGVLFQLGSALLAAGAVKVYVDKSLSIEAAVWILMSGVIIWVGWKWLGLLESES